MAVIDGGKVKAELRDVGDSGERALKRIEEASRPASRALQTLDGVAGEVRGGLEQMAARAGPLGAGLMRIGPAGLAAAAALGAVTLGLKESLEEAAKADQSYRRLEAVLKATGHASGLTADEIAAFADGIERSTLATAEGVQDAASVLATFRSVSGETFTRALSLAQDMSAVFGQDLSGAADAARQGAGGPDRRPHRAAPGRHLVLGYAEGADPHAGRDRPAGGSAAGDPRCPRTAGRRRRGCRSRQADRGDQPAAGRLGQSAGGDRQDAGGHTALAQGALDLLSGAIRDHVFDRGRPDQPAYRGGNRTAGTGARRLDRLQAGGPGTPMLGQRSAIDEQRQRVAALEQELATLTRLGEAEADAARQERARAEAGQQTAEVERRADALAAQRSQLAKALDQLATGPPSASPQVNRELAETKAPGCAPGARQRQRVECGHCDPGGGRDRPAQIAAINQPLEEAAKRAWKRPNANRRPGGERGATAFQENEKVVDDLAKQLALFGDERRQFVDQALSRLSETATDEQWVQVERLANALWDEKLAREQLAESLRAEQQLRQHGVRLTEQMRTPAEELAATLQQLDALMRAGAIDAGTHGRAVAEAYHEAELAADRMLSASREWQDGVTRALRDYADQATDAASAAEQVTTQAFQGMEDALVAFVQTGKLDFGSLRGLAGRRPDAPVDPHGGSRPAGAGAQWRRWRARRLHLRVVRWLIDADSGQRRGRSGPRAGHRRALRPRRRFRARQRHPIRRRRHRRSADAVSDGTRPGADGRGRTGGGAAAEATGLGQSGSRERTHGRRHRQRHQQRRRQGRDAAAAGRTRRAHPRHPDRRGRDADGGARRAQRHHAQPGAGGGGQPAAGALAWRPGRLPCRKSR
ncbi:MAG: hypothetical protein IPK78_18935 [Rhodospirillales bacterium]|nr:hypothetical protein [Rhodospirillales bacterium]